MKRYTIEKTATTTAPASEVFDRLIDAPSWPEWSPIGEGQVTTKVDRPGGVGEVREFHTGKRTSVERVVESNRPRRLSYVLESGLPLDGYRADVDIEPVNGGTRIRWHSEFGAKPVAGFVYQKALGRFIGQTVEGLASHLDQASASTGSSGTGSSSGGVPGH